MPLTKIHVVESRYYATQIRASGNLPGVTYGADQTRNASSEDCRGNVI